MKLNKHIHEKQLLFNYIIQIKINYILKFKSKIKFKDLWYFRHLFGVREYI